MKYKLFGLLVLISLLGSLAGAGPVLAQTPTPPKPAPPPPPTPPVPPGFDGEMGPRSAFGAIAGALDSQSLPPLGEPGFNFRYSETFGVTNVAYVGDTTHLNYPWGIGAAGSDIWIGELWGDRAMKYDDTGNAGFLQQIGTAGVGDYDDTALWEIADVAQDAGGNAWVVDRGASHVAKYNPAGVLIKELGVVWGGGASNSRFDSPVSIAFDAAGNIYVSDGSPWWDWNGTLGNQRVQIFNSAGTYLHTIGVTGVAGSDNNHLRGPRHIATYGSGLASRLYIADAANDRVQIFNISNPSAPTFVARLTGVSRPSGVAVDANYIYVSDGDNSYIKIFNRTTRAYVTTLGTGWGAGDYEFKWPTDVAVAGGKLYVADFVNTRVQQFTRTGTLVAPIFTYSGTYGTTGVPYTTDMSHYFRPSGVAVDAGGNIYVTEEMGHRLVKLNSGGTPLWSVGAPGVKGDWDSGANDRLNNPGDVAVDSTNVYVADRWHGRVQVYAQSDGHYVNGKLLGGDHCPGGVHVAGGRLYVADSCDSTVVVLDSGTLNEVTTLGISGNPGSDNSHFNGPQDVAVDGLNNVYVADQNNHRVQVFDAGNSYAYLRTIGVSGNCGSDFAHLCGPYGLFTDSANRLYVSDQWNNRVQVFDSTGAYLTTVGGSWGSKDGQLRTPQGITVDSSGNLYVADWENDRIQKYLPGVPGWSQVNINGFGNPWVSDTEYFAVFHGKLYTAANGAGAQVWRSNEGDDWSPMMTNSFGDATNRGINQLIVFHDQLYAGTWNCINNNCTTSKGGQVWRTDGTTWSKVVDKGFGQTANYTVGAFAEFSGQLYAVTDSLNGTPQVYRSSSGDTGTWSRVMANGFGGNGAWTDISMGVYGGSLYVGFGRGYPGVLGELWRCTICDGTDWSPVFTDGRGNSNNQAVRAITEYDGRLYIALSNRTDGAEVWSCATCDGTDWSPLLTGGKGDLNNNFADGLYVYGGNLYVILGSLQNGVEVWHCHLCNGDWTQDASGGWGDANNLLASYFNKGAAAFGGRLFIGTANWGNGGEIWATDAPSYPVVASIIRADASPTTASSVNFTVSFSDDVTGVTAGDFTLAATTKLTGASITDVSGSGRTWTVTVGNYTGNGTLRLDLADDDTIMDAGLDPLGGSGMGNGDFSSGESYMIPASKTYTSIAGQDGWVLESGELTNKGGSMNAGATTFNLGDDALNRQYRSILSFDTSGSPLPGGAVITSVTLKITKAGMVGGNPFKTLGKLLVDIQHGTFGTALLQVTDFQSAASKGSVLTFTNGVYSNSLSSSYFNYVNPAGMMQFRLRFTKDDNNNLLADYLKFYSGNYATVPANQPTLIITYYVP